MKIVTLDGYTENPGDLSWDGFKKLGETVIYDRTKKEEIIERARDAEIIYTNKTKLPEDILKKLPKLKFIGVLATGYDVVDIDTARELEIPVANVPTYGTDSVAQMVFSHLFALTRHIKHHSGEVKKSRWANNPDFCFWDYPLIELTGLTMGIIGFGRIGQATAKIAQAMGMKIISYSGHTKKVPGIDFKWVSFDDILIESDILTLHCPLTSETEGMINKYALEKMKNTAFLINTARGPLIVEKDLAESLNKGQIAGAGLDVLSVEPPESDNPLLKAKNCNITPHIAWATKSARARLMDIAVDNLKAFLDGTPKNIVNMP